MVSDFQPTIITSRFILLYKRFSIHSETKSAKYTRGVIGEIQQNATRQINQLFNEIVRKPLIYYFKKGRQWLSKENIVYIGDYHSYRIPSIKIKLKYEGTDIWLTQTHFHMPQFLFRKHSCHS